MADTANQKISELPAVSSAASNDVLAGVKSNTTSKFPLSVLKTFFQSGLTKSNVGLNNVDNTSDANKPVSTAQQAAIDAAVQEAEAAIPSPSTADPQMDGTASPGSSGAWSRGDHVHPSDTSRVPVIRTVNGKALSADIILDYGDVGASAAISLGESESSATATRNHAEGDLFEIGGDLIVALTAIANGEAFEDGVNIEVTTIAAQLAARDARIAALETALDGLVSQLAQM